MSRAASASGFVYVAVRAAGGRTLGVRQAKNQGALSSMLRREGLLLLRCWRVPAWATGGESALRLKDHVTLNEQLAQLLSRGVALVEALDVAAETMRGGATAKISRIRQLVAGGSSFADACKTVGGFDAVTIAVYRGAERTGDLAGAAKQLAQNGRRRLAIGNKVGTLLAYPCVVLTISLVVSSAMLVGIVPKLHEALLDAGVTLPAFSRVVMGTGTWMKGHLTGVLLIVAGVVAALIVLRRVVAAFAGGILRRTPVIKEVVLAQENARFFSVMAAMTRTGVNLSDALAVANQAVSHPVLRGQLEGLRKKLIGGGMLRVLIDEVSAFPVSTRRLLIAAERSGDMEAAFNTLAEDMIELVETRSARLLALLEPALIVLMAGMIGTLVVSILLPMLTMTSRVAN